ncbi:MAG: RNA polymerase sigma-70 factor [Daejeonella sp.]|uniref:RNA polymerase sigma-70 factor n=1 Tax=Daejeonella sp. JGW-45 TaxID=3034148 RepID=UPI0023EADA7A|nr:RNA polymerase sigma-70 factor [Daejeonella sp. JGW-45]
MTDGNFSRKVNNVDIKAFEDVFKCHYVKLTLYANKFLNDVDIAEEIVSESLAQLWEKRESINFSSSVTAYLYTMVRHKSMNYLKHRKVENEYVNYLMRNNLINELPEHDTDPLLEKEIACQIKLAVDSLPERCRQVFIMSRFEYLKNREIAQRLNISQNTVERQITIALDKLRKSLECILSAALLLIL